MVKTKGNQVVQTMTAQIVVIQPNPKPQPKAPSPTPIKKKTNLMGIPKTKHHIFISNTKVDT